MASVYKGYIDSFVPTATGIVAIASDTVDIDFIPFVPIKHIFWLSVILTSVPKFSAPIVTFMASDDEILSRF
jgi:hypothetical protein